MAQSIDTFKWAFLESLVIETPTPIYFGDRLIGPGLGVTVGPTDLNYGTALCQRFLKGFQVLVTGIHFNWADDANRILSVYGWLDCLYHSLKENESFNPYFKCQFKEISCRLIQITTNDVSTSE